MEQFDVAILGGGPGGYVAAIRAAQLGLKAALIEKEELGGTCLNWGCVPTKSLLRNAEVIGTLEKGADFGFSFDHSTLRVDYAAAQQRSRQVSGKLVRGLSSLMAKNGVTVLRARGVLAGTGRVQLDTGDIITAKNIILATGAAPVRIPFCPQDERVMTSRDILEMTTLPDSLLIVGAGAIGVEFAYLMQSYGVAVTLVEAMPRIMPNEDADIAKELEKALRKSGIVIHTGTKLEQMEIRAGRVVSTLNDGKTATTLDTARALISVGIAPNTANIGLESIGLTTERGFVTVDAQMRTQIPGVYAIGDITGKLALAHTASAQGIAAVEHIAGIEHSGIAYENIARCTYCSPETASAGLTEAEARARGLAVQTGKSLFRANAKALALDEPEGFVKIVADANTGEIYGVHMIGPHVTELIAQASALISLEATLDEAVAMISPHPTLSEIFTEAAGDALGRAIHM